MWCTVLLVILLALLLAVSCAFFAAAAPPAAALNVSVHAKSQRSSIRPAWRDVVMSSVLCVTKPGERFMDFH
jgi:hypothetical protein